jgi:acetyl-CoA C-acetyltransferase
MKTVYLVAALRTPIGSWGGTLAGFSATQLGAAAIKGVLEHSGIAPDQIEEVYFGNVCSANLGQAPARQAARGAGIPDHVPCTTINKVCASGMKAMMLGAQSIQLGLADVVLAGGMESMSNIPYYVPSARWGSKYGHVQMVDGLQKDGLTDAYDQKAMGNCGDATASKYGISREAQDQYAIRSYQLAGQSSQEGWFKKEIVPVAIPQRKGDPVMMAEDEEYKKVDFSKIPGLKPAFSADGTVTAANASTINDGAAAILLMSEEKMNALGLKPLAKLVAYADAEQEPQWFTTTPIKAAKKALERAGLTIAAIDFFEVNEAFAVVPMVFAQELGITEDKLNVFGGAVAIGHPLGASGARIITTLGNVLQQRGGKYGLAAICNGGGGASAVILERV